MISPRARPPVTAPPLCPWPCFLATWPWGMIPNKKRPEQSAGHLGHLWAGRVRTRNPRRGGLAAPPCTPTVGGGHCSWHLAGLLYGVGWGDTSMSTGWLPGGFFFSVCEPSFCLPARISLMSLTVATGCMRMVHAQGAGPRPAGKEDAFSILGSPAASCR